MFQIYGSTTAINCYLIIPACNSASTILSLMMRFKRWFSSSRCSILSRWCRASVFQVSSICSNSYNFKHTHNTYEMKFLQFCLYTHRMNLVNSRNDSCQDDSTINIVPCIIIIINEVGLAGCPLTFVLHLFKSCASSRANQNFHMLYNTILPCLSRVSLCLVPSAAIALVIS